VTSILPHIDLHVALSLLVTQQRAHGIESQRLLLTPLLMLPLLPLRGERGGARVCPFIFGLQMCLARCVHGRGSGGSRI
jgi:hypothetical protein